MSKRTCLIFQQNSCIFSGILDDQRHISLPPVIASAISSIVFFDDTPWRSSATAPLVKLGYSYRYVDLSLYQHLLRSSVLLQVRQKCLRWTALPLWSSNLNGSWLGCNFFLFHVRLFCFFTFFRTTWISSTLVRWRSAFLLSMFIH